MPTNDPSNLRQLFDRVISEFGEPAVYGFIFALFIPAIMINILAEYAAKKERKQYAEKVQEKIDALGRMQLNLEDIKEFYIWSQNQAKAAFILAVIMFALGFGLIAVSVAYAFAPNADLDAAIIPAIGGAVTEFIAATTLVIYRSSLSQLNHYHQALHEDERFLSSVNLIGKFHDEELQDEMLKEIIRSEIQMNLDSIKQNKKEDKKAADSKKEEESQNDTSDETKEEASA